MEKKLMVGERGREGDIFISVLWVFSRVCEDMKKIKKTLLWYIYKEKEQKKNSNTNLKWVKTNYKKRKRDVVSQVFTLYA